MRLQIGPLEEKFILRIHIVILQSQKGYSEPFN